jgi:hypothetical protein
VAKTYADFLDIFLIAPEDHRFVAPIESLGVRTLCTDIRMNVRADKERLAAEVLASVPK